MVPAHIACHWKMFLQDHLHSCNATLAFHNPEMYRCHHLHLEVLATRYQIEDVHDLQ